jgi:hypothetical protein
MLPHFWMRLFLDVGSEEEVLLPSPPRSPDLTPLDIFAWGFIKDVVYSRKVRDLADFRQRIIEAIELITPHMLINAWQKLEYRLDICRATISAHIEVYGRA